MASDERKIMDQEIFDTELDLRMYASDQEQVLKYFILRQTLSDDNYNNLYDSYHHSKFSLENEKNKEHELLKTLMDIKIKKMKQEIMKEVMEELHGPGGLSEKMGKIRFSNTCSDNVYTKR